MRVFKEVMRAGFSAHLMRTCAIVGSLVGVIVSLAMPVKAAAQACGVCGDINGDGEADIVDALFIAQFTVGSRTELACPEAAAVDGSAAIDIADALVIAQFTVGARTKLLCALAPLQVQITNPPSGRITKEPKVSVSGQIGTGVTTVTVNGIPANINGSQFSAEITLTGGINMIVAVASDGSGNSGVASIEVTLDNFAPAVAIDSPANGFVTTESAVTVTGKVNDTVSGGTTPQVTVNGLAASVQQGTFVVLGLPLVPGPNTIEAVARDSVGNEARHAINVELRQVAGARPRIVSGDGQQGLVGKKLPSPLVVEVVDENGSPLAGRIVTFEVSANSGTIRTSSSEPQRHLQIPTGGDGRASVFFTLGDRSGQGNNRVTASSVGATGQVVFCASAVAAPAQRILAVLGENQTGLIGAPLPAPFETLVIDADGNPVAGVPVSFTVQKGAGNLDGETVKQVVTGDDGQARAVLTLGLEPGINSNSVSAAFPGLPGLPATFVASSLAAGAPEDTRFAGVVLDNANTPIPGAIVRLFGTTIETQTDDQGQFLLRGIPVGVISLVIDPTNSPRPEHFPPLAFETVTIAGQINRLPGGPIRIPALSSDAKVVGGNLDVTLEMKGVPGLTLTVFAHSAKFPGGSSIGFLSINQVHLDKVPMPPPSGTLFMPPAWTIQPAGVEFNPPARITIPNDGLPPGRVIDIFQFDHPLNRFINVGSGTVTEDASIIVSNPGFGITRTGWGGCGQPQPPNTCASSCDDGNRCTDDSCQNGGCTHVSLTTPPAATMCQGCDNGKEIKKKSDAECCDEIGASGGFVVCCNGDKTACLDSSFDGTDKGSVIIRECALKHEKDHFDDIDCPGGLDKCKTTQPNFKPGSDPGQEECNASRVNVACLQNSDCKGDATCQARVDGDIAGQKKYGNDNKAGCFP